MNGTLVGTCVAMLLRTGCVKNLTKDVSECESLKAPLKLRVIGERDLAVFSD